MIKIKFKIVFVFLFIFISSLKAQIVYEPLNSGLYDFLERVANKGLIEYYDLIKPLPRKYIYEKLYELAGKKEKLTRLEKDELNYYLRDFLFEKKLLHPTHDKYEKIVTKPKLFRKDENKRFRIYSYAGDNIKFNFTPLFSFETGTWEKEKYFHLRYGIRTEGYLGKSVGFNFQFMNNREEPNIRDFVWNRFSPKTGRNISLADGSRVEYGEVYVNVSADWDWGSFSIGQNLTTWGYAENGQIVTSTKSPAYPAIRLDIYPTDWIHFNYMHGWLNSDVIDSNSFYTTFRYDPVFNTDRFNWRQKFIAQHTVTITPTKGLDLSLGESVIYADRLEMAYLIPLMFFDQADEHISRDKNRAGSNTQFFLAASSRNHIPNTHIWGSFYADELTPEGLFDPEKQYYKFAFTFGSVVVDFPIDNLSLRTEYTKIYPATYRHFIPTLTYENSSYLLGHWLGDNADLVYVDLTYRILRGLKVKLWGQMVRKGAESLGDRGYDIPMEPFLYGLRRNYKYFGFEINYEMLHDIKFDFQFNYINESKQQSDLTFKDKFFRQLLLRISYGY